jgi:YihY family inner membrane protein
VGTVTRTGLWRLALAVHRRASADDVATLSGALTYQAFLSLLPLAILGLSVTGFVLAGDPARRAEVVDAFARAIPGLGPLIERNVRAAVEGRFVTGIVGLAGLAWRGSALADQAALALARVFRTERPGLVRRRLAALVRVALLGTLGLATVVLTGLATVALTGEAARRAVGVLLAAGADLAFFLLSYRALSGPNAPPLRGHLPGALLMTAGWTSLKVGGSWFVVIVVGRATALYGTVGAVFGLFAILAVAAKLFLYGAELSATLAEARR